MSIANKALVISLPVIALAAPALAGAEIVGEWNLKVEPGSFVRSSSMVGLRNGLTYGKLVLFQSSNGAYSVRMQGTTVDDCLNVEVPAEVTKSASTTTIIPGKRFPSCPLLRLEVNNDGSGGNVQMNVGKRGAVAWVLDEDHSYGLTPR